VLSWVTRYKNEFDNVQDVFELQVRMALRPVKRRHFPWGPSASSTATFRWGKCSVDVSLASSAKYMDGRLTYDVYCRET